MNTLKRKFLELKNKIQQSVLYQKCVVLLGLILTQLAIRPAYAEDINIKGGITKMVEYVSLIVCGVGIIYFVIAVFKWISAIKQDDPERASAQITNVFVAIVLIGIGGIAAALLSAFGVTETYGL